MTQFHVIGVTWLDLTKSTMISATVSDSLSPWSNHGNSFEKKYDPIPVLNWMRDHPIVPIVGVMLYGVLIFLGQYMLKDKESWKWRNTLATWNLFLSAFSTIGMLRTAPQLVHNLTTLSLRDNLCTDPRVTYGSGSTGLWVQLFILSKFPWVQLDYRQGGDWNRTYTEAKHSVLTRCNTPITVNSLTPFSSLFIRSLSFSFIGTTTLPSCSTAGILMWPHHHLESFLLSWTTPYTPVCTSIMPSWHWNCVPSGSIPWSLLHSKLAKWLSGWR